MHHFLNTAFIWGLTLFGYLIPHLNFIDIAVFPIITRETSLFVMQMLTYSAALLYSVLSIIRWYKTKPKKRK